MEKLPEMAAFFVKVFGREVYPERSRREPKRGSEEVEKLPEMAAFFVEPPVLAPKTGDFVK
ncbi:hypothetical protein L0P88_08260 [Muricauda sp. SCSIO 64092]|uniref:hypothetical protein n=1 Tax=Allomuricauda sp. SCSIO 64092 TaxID=2908842 RepID=UPI001FF50526|nr:hypothetical protein [Muricauda sp. SCSIO 64092]UOY08535.1 hypothetical protein L0P88_08260 [Muricauda sp. SCSIO 64092]